MLRPASWTRPAGVSRAWVGIGAPGSRPGFVIERWRAERGVGLVVESDRCTADEACTCGGLIDIIGSGNVFDSVAEGIDAAHSPIGRGTGNA